MANQSWKIRLSGTGGQGVIKAAVILAEAALVDGRNATQSQVYGPESRGGSTRAEVKISDSAVLFPKVIGPNMLICLSQQAYEKYSDDLIHGGILIVDGDVAQGTERPGVNIYRCPITDLTRDLTGNELSVNVMALGVMNAIGSMVTDEGMEESLRRNFKAKVAEANIKVYYAGKEAAKAITPYTK